MNKRNILIGGAVVISVLALGISIGSLVRVNDKDFGSVTINDINEEYDEKHEKAVKELAAKLTKDLGLDFEVDEYDSDYISAGSVIGEGTLGVNIYVCEGKIDDIVVGMKNNDDNDELNKKFEEVSKYLCADISGGDEVGKKVKKLYDKMTSDEYRKSDEYINGIYDSCFYESVRVRDIEVDLNIYDLEKPEMGIELTISKY